SGPPPYSDVGRQPHHHPQQSHPAQHWQRIRVRRDPSPSILNSTQTIIVPRRRCNAVGSQPHTRSRMSLNEVHGIFIPGGVFFKKHEDGKARGRLFLAAPWWSGYSHKREVTANPGSRCDENQLSAGVRRRVPSRGVLQKRGAARGRDAGGKPGGGARRRISGTAGGGAPPGFLYLPAQDTGERQIARAPKQQALSHPG